MKTEYFLQFQEADRFLRCRYISLTSTSCGDCNDSVTVNFPTVYKFSRCWVKASNDFVTVTFYTVFKLCQCRVSVICLKQLVNFYVTNAGKEFEKVNTIPSLLMGLPGISKHLK